MRKRKDPPDREQSRSSRRLAGQNSGHIELPSSKRVKKTACTPQNSSQTAPTSTPPRSPASAAKYARQHELLHANSFSRHHSPVHGSEITPPPDFAPTQEEVQEFLSNRHGYAWGKQRGLNNELDEEEIQDEEKEDEVDQLISDEASEDDHAAADGFDAWQTPGWGGSDDEDGGEEEEEEEEEEDDEEDISDSDDKELAMPIRDALQAVMSTDDSSDDESYPIRPVHLPSARRTNKAPLPTKIISTQKAPRKPRGRPPKKSIRSPTPPTAEEALSTFTVKFLVPFDGASDSLTVSSDDSWMNFCYALADLISLPRKQVHTLSYGYRFSTWTQKHPFGHLSEERHLTELMSEARDVLAQKKKPTKPFLVELKELNVEAGRKKGADAKNAKKSQKRHQSVSEDEKEFDDGDSLDRIRARFEAGKKLGPAQYVALIQADNICKRHNGHCVKVQGQCVKGWKSTVVPPSQLKLEDGAKKQKSTKAPSDDPFSTPRSLYPAPPPPTGYPYGYPLPPPSLYYPPPPLHDANYYTPSAVYGRPPPSRHDAIPSRHDAIPSSDGAIEDILVFPRIGDWLQQLDAGPRGQDGDQFFQYGDDFATAKCHRICELADSMTADELMGICENMQRGTARRLITYAQQDVKRIRKTVEKGKTDPMRYP
ncbi:hypothetical protein BDZ89DRAFT_1198526 [Hymenopellis radicata]|nr:hypothetical protein BDZ89DRAFT_1198526 [Hymenopellis radicata]